jgi:hydroxymethylglutaryl-CoA lyase
MHTHSRTIFPVPKTRVFSNTLPQINPILFDVSLRDGLQGANPLDYPTARKLEMLNSICEKSAPDKIEIGAFVSPKVLPIMSDTADVYAHINESTIAKNAGHEVVGVRGFAGEISEAKRMESRKSNTTTTKTPEIYALVPNKVGLMNAIKSGVRNFSFITSVSNAFQVKNTGKNLLYKKTELDEMMRNIVAMRDVCKTKLYISCINECPVNGRIDNDFIVYEILSYGDLEIDELCLSDTMGTLKFADFEYIVDGLIRFGIATSRISVHLHIDEGNSANAKMILFACFRRGINRFDVSVISDGGCSVTMNKNQLKPNMSYEFFYEAFKEYYE